MRTYALATLLALVAVSTPAASQQMNHEHGAGMAAIQPLYERIKGLYLRSAEVMPEEQYGFRPTAEVRTFAQLLGHVVNDHYLFCSVALGEENPNEADFEETTSATELTAALAASITYCDRAYAMPEMRAMEEVEFFGRRGSRLWVLVFNVMHDSEHYGNIVTYLRMNGIVPPSSRGGM